VGTFLPVMVFIPLFGTTFTILGFSAFLLAVALGGLGISAGWRRVLRFAWMPLILAAVAIMLSGKALKTTTGQIFETESAYNYIEVLETDGYRFLRLNEGQGVHSQWHPTELDYHGPWEQFHAAPFFNNPGFSPEQVQRIAVIGLAAGTTARQASQVFGLVPIDGYGRSRDHQGRAAVLRNDHAQPDALRRMAIGIKTLPHLYAGGGCYRPPYIPDDTRGFSRSFTTWMKGVMAINVGRAPPGSPTGGCVADKHGVSLCVCDGYPQYLQFDHLCHRPADQGSKPV
jgi:hypothetical protein